MTDKQIIIDGSDCGYYNDGICWNEDVVIKHCAECNDCYHKTVKTLREQLDQLKAKHKEAVNDLLSIQYKLADNNKKLRQCLTEIKEIAEHCMKQDICTTCDNSDRCYIEDEEIPTYDVCKLILQKISEVIE